MTLRSVGRLPLGLLWISSLFVSLGVSQVSRGNPLIAAAPHAAPCDSGQAKPSRAFPVATLDCGRQLSFVGSYSPDGKYQAASRTATPAYVQNYVTASGPTARPPEVPPAIDLHSREQVIENFQPPYRARKPAKGPSRLAALRDDIVTFAYGREQLLLRPRHVISDSTGRVILTDPAASAVHVLDGENSFRISAGQNKRLIKPSGLAVDADDNIYIADSEQGLIAVYDRNGSFLRYIGKLGRDETLFHVPIGIAIDAGRARLYVVDSDRQMLFILDLSGREIKRVGRFNGNDTIVNFTYPTEIAIGDDELAIMDASGSRVWVTDLDGTPRTNFRFPTPLRQGVVDELGLAIDAGGNIYISNGTGSSVQVFDSRGNPLSTFGRGGQSLGEFQSPTGLWIDSHDRIFVADEITRRVQVFQLSPRTQEPELVAAGE